MRTGTGWRTTLCGLLLLLVTPAAAGEIAGVRFEERYERDGIKLDLSCLGLLRYRYVIKAYVAGLYLGEGVAPERVLTDVPKRLEIVYFWNIAGDDIRKAGEQFLAKNIDAATLARIRPQLERLGSLYEDVKPGDRYSLTYAPGVGMELALNGKRKGVLEGAELANAYFRIWLGEEPIDAALRDQLLTCDARA